MRMNYLYRGWFARVVFSREITFYLGHVSKSYANEEKRGALREKIAGENPA